MIAAVVTQDGSTACMKPPPCNKPEASIAPSPYHDDGLIDALAEALVEVWQELGLPRKQQPLAAE